MQGKLSFVVIATLTAGIVILTIGRQEAVGQRPAAQARWEYKVVKFRGGHGSQAISPDDIATEMNRLAADGWEYVGPVLDVPTTPTQGYLSSQCFVAFKRPPK